MAERCKDPEAEKVIYSIKATAKFNSDAAVYLRDCIKRGKTVQEGGAVYNFTGPQGFGIANMADSLYAIY